MDDVVQCPRCHYIRRSADRCPAGECPRCGVIYAKFDPEVELKRERLREIGESRLALDRRADSLLVAVREHIEGWSHRLRWVPLLIGAAGILVVGAGAFLFFWFVFAVILKVALF